MFYNATFHSIEFEYSMGRERYLLFYSSYNRSYNEPIQYKTSNQTRDLIRNIIEAKAHVNIVVYRNTSSYVASSLFTTAENTIKVILTDEIERSPDVLNRNIMIWEEDILSPYFARLIFEKMKSILCS